MLLWQTCRHTDRSDISVARAVVTDADTIGVELRSEGKVSPVHLEAASKVSKGHVQLVVMSASLWSPKKVACHCMRYGTAHSLYGLSGRCM